MTAALPLMKSVLTPLAKGISLPLELSAGMSAADAATQNKTYGSRSTALKFWNEKIEDILKIVESLEQKGLLIKGISETIKNEAKEKQKKISFNVLRNISC